MRKPRKQARTQRCFGAAEDLAGSSRRSGAVLSATGAEPGSVSRCSPLPERQRVSAESLSPEGPEQKPLLLLCREEEDFVGSAVQLPELHGL